MAAEGAKAALVELAVLVALAAAHMIRPCFSSGGTTPPETVEMGVLAEMAAAAAAALVERQSIS